MAKKMTRRDFLLAAISTVGGLTLLEVIQKVSKAQYWPFQRHVPLVSPGVDPSRTPTPTPTSPPTATPTPTATTSVPVIPGLPPLPPQSIVTHVRHASVTSWGGPNSSTRYWDNSVVNQAKVNTMIEAGLKDLTGQSSENASWDVLFKRINAAGYQAGQKVAIKINMNCADYNGGNCTTHSATEVDALPQVVLGVVESLHRAGVPYNAIYIYDATTSGQHNTVHGKAIYKYFRDQFAGKAVHFVGNGSCIEQCSYGVHNSLTVDFASTHKSKGLKTRKLTDTLYHASYLINIPILKAHSPDTDTGFTAAFKNHLGSINYVLGDGGDQLHNYIMSQYPQYSSTVESPMVSIYKNPHIGGKTILTLCDGLYGGEWSHRPLNNWKLFGNQPANSMLFAIDPVALDCIVADIIRSESTSPYYKGNERPYDFLHHAADAGLGRFESQYPYDGTDKYTTIVYNRINLS